MTDTLRNLKLNSQVGSSTILEIYKDFYVILSFQMDEILTKINQDDVLSNLAIQKVQSTYGINQYDLYFRDTDTGIVERIARLTQAMASRKRDNPKDCGDVQVISQVSLVENTIADKSLEIYSTFDCKDDEELQEENKKKIIDIVNKIVSNPKFSKTCTMKKDIQVLDSDAGKFIEVQLTSESKDIRLSYIFEGKLITPGYYRYRLQKIRFPQDLCE